MWVMQVIARSPTPFSLPGRVVPVATERWLLEPWHGDDPPELRKIWSIKPMYAAAGARSCAELVIADQLAREGWGAVWVSAFAGERLRTRWFPAEGYRTITETGAPAWAAGIFNRLRAENGGTLGGFFDVFAWHEPDQVCFVEAKNAGDRVTPSQCRFLATALRFHELGQFKVIKARPRP